LHLLLHKAKRKSYMGLKAWVVALFESLARPFIFVLMLFSSTACTYTFYVHKNK
jgi:hypothetical protein